MKRLRVESRRCPDALAFGGGAAVVGDVDPPRIPVAETVVAVIDYSTVRDVVERLLAGVPAHVRVVAGVEAYVDGVVRWTEVPTRKFHDFGGAVAGACILHRPRELAQRRRRRQLEIDLSPTDFCPCSKPVHRAGAVFADDAAGNERYWHRQCWDDEKKEQRAKRDRKAEAAARYRHKVLTGQDMPP